VSTFVNDSFEGHVRSWGEHLVERDASFGRGSGHRPLNVCVTWAERQGNKCRIELHVNPWYTPVVGNHVIWYLRG